MSCYTRRHQAETVAKLCSPGADMVEADVTCVAHQCAKFKASALPRQVEHEQPFRQHHLKTAEWWTPRQEMLMWQHSVEFISFDSLRDSRQNCLFAHGRQILSALKQTCKADQPDTMRTSMFCTPKALLHDHNQTFSTLYRAA